MNKKYLNIIIIILLAILSIGVSFAYSSYSAKELLSFNNIKQIIIFENLNSDKNSKYIDIITKYMVYCYRDSQPEIYKGMINHKWSIDKILNEMYITRSGIKYILVDLNDDQEYEILYMITDVGNDHGYSFDIIKKNGENYTSIWSNMAYSEEPILILKTKINGFYNIYVNDYQGGTFLIFDKENNSYSAYDKKLKERKINVD